jgi:hypothetical protein
MKNQKKHLRQEGAIKRTEASIVTYEEQLKNSNNSDEMNKLIKRKIERAKTTIKNTKII